MPDTMMSSAEVWFLNMAEKIVPERHQNHHHDHHHHHHHHHQQQQQQQQPQQQQQQQPVATIIAPSIYCSVSSSAMELKYGCFCHSSFKLACKKNLNLNQRENGGTFWMGALNNQPYITLVFIGYILYLLIIKEPPPLSL